MYKNFTKFLCMPHGYIHKLLLIMNLTTILLVVTMLQVSAAGFAQRITFVQKDATLKQIFTEIQRQTGYSVLLSGTEAQSDQRIDADFKDASLEQVLKTVLKNQSVDFTIEDKMIVIRDKSLSFLDKIIGVITAINVHGKVVDAKGSPIPGATILVKDRSQVTTTDMYGNFFLQQVDPKGILVISHVGYLTREVNVKADLGVITLDISNTKLDELVVIGYETTTKRLSTGSVGQVSSADIDEQPVSNPILAMEGRTPGVFITQSAGYAGASINVVVRGQNNFVSTTGEAAPLYVIDGVPFGSSPVEQSVGGFGAVGFSPLNTINPSDIESIDVLKDADATAIYGSRGANGVILITTKKGKAGNTKFSVDLSTGFGHVTHLMPLLGTAQYLNLRRQAFANDGVTPTTANAPDLTLWDTTAYTNFPKLLLGNTSHQTNAAFSLSGGDNFTQFLFSGNYRHESTVYDTHTADDAAQFHLTMQHRSHDSKFGTTISVAYNLDDNTIPSYTLTTTNYALPPDYPLYNPNGSLYFGPGYTNPLAGFNSTQNLKSTNMVANAGFHYMLLPGLDLKANVGYNYDDVTGATIEPSSANNPLFNYPQLSILNNNYIKTDIAEPQLNYTHTFGRGRLTAIAGGSWQETQTVQPYFILGLFTNIQLATSPAALTVLVNSSGYTDYKYESGFGRLEYEWDGKYFFSGNIRRDGSSRFGADRQFGNFGSGAAAWIFSNEKFVKGNLPWLSFGKIRTSYGSVGNDHISDYSYESTYSSTSAYGPTNSLTPTRIENPYLQWEVTKKWDAAIDLGFLHDRLLLSADFYRNRTSNLLGSTPLPTQDGFGAYTSNLPAGVIVQNKGVELELTTVNLKSKSVTWRTSFNLTIPKNELLSFPGIANTTYANTYVVGQSLNLRTVFHSTGIVNGIPTVADVNKDGLITTGISENGKGDYIVDGNNDPKLYGGMNNTLIYKGFQLDILFQAVSRTATRGDLIGYPGQGYDIAKSLLSLPLKWSATAGSPASNAFFYYTNSDAAVENASYIRLKTLSLAYNATPSWAKRMKMSYFQVYVHGQNLLTITKYKGIDPETQSLGVPTIRMIIAGIKATF